MTSAYATSVLLPVILTVSVSQDCLIHSDVLLPAGVTTGCEIETHADETNNAQVRTHLQRIQRGVCYPAASNDLPSFSVIEVW